MNDEYLDLVDSEDNVIGKKLRSEVYAEKLSNFRVINAFLVNSRGELWIPRRSKNKRIFPFCLDMSVGGHVESGEDYYETFKRETEEELNINIDDFKVDFLGSMNPVKDGVSAFMNVYEIKSDEAPKYNKEDFIEYVWITPEDLMNKIKDGEKTKDDLPKVINHFYFNK